MRHRVTNYIKGISIVLLLGGLYAFSTLKNNARKINKINVHIANTESLLITPNTVRNMLIEKLKRRSIGSKHQVSLNGIESSLEENDFIESVEAFFSIGSELNILVNQKKPIVRIQANRPFYLDALGHRMPLSKVFSPRVPVFFNWNSSVNLPQVALLTKAIEEDKFLKKHITSIWRDKNDYMMGVRVYDFNIRFGKSEQIDLKFLNFKAFFQRAVIEKTLSKYTEVNLKYKGQVVCKVKK